MEDLKIYVKMEDLNEYEKEHNKISFKRLVDKLFSDMEHNGVMDLYNNIELPLSNVLGKMEYEGVNVDVSILDLMGKDIFPDLLRSSAG